jgi:hypothetical protein
MSPRSVLVIGVADVDVVSPLVGELFLKLVWEFMCLQIVQVAELVVVVVSVVVLLLLVMVVVVVIVLHHVTMTVIFIQITIVDMEVVVQALMKMIHS